MAQVPAAERTIAVLRHLAAQARPVTAVSVARALELPRSSTYHLLAALAEARFVVHLPEERRWALGVGAFELGQAYLRAQPLERLARPLLHRLAHDTHTSSHLAILDGRDVVYLATERPPQTPVLVVDVGVRLPAHLTASGRCLLAAMPAAQVHALFPPGRSLPTRTGRGPTSPSQLRRVLATTRRRGHGVEEDEVVDGVASVAVAARDHDDRAVAAVTLVLPSDASRDGLVEAAHATAEALSRRLRGRD